MINLFNRFKKPTEERLEELLGDLGIVKGDQNFKALKSELRALIPRKSKLEKGSLFFSNYSRAIYKKVDTELKQRNSELSEKEDEIRDLKAELEKERNKTLSTFVTQVFSKNVFGFIDEPCFNILKILSQRSEDEKSIQKKTKLSYGDFFWRVDFLGKLGLLTPTYTNNKTIYHLAKTFEKFFSRKRDIFENHFKLQKDVVEDLSRKAVGGNKQWAKKLRSWLKSDRFKGHKDMIRKLWKKYRNPSQVSQAFFGLRETGTNHEKHIGIRIKDHRSTGKLLVLGI